MAASLHRWGVVIVAAGSGERFGDRMKALRDVGGEPLLLHSVRAFCSVPSVEQIVVVLGTHTFEAGARLLARAACSGKVRVATGGATRSASVRAGLDAMPAEVNFVAVHDAARPLIRPGLITSVLAAAERTGAAVPALPVTDTLIEVDSAGRFEAAVDRSRMRAAQTPQAAKRDWVMRALDAYPDETDEGSAISRAGYPVELVDGEPDNVKVTWPDDVAIIEALLERSRGV